MWQSWQLLPHSLADGERPLDMSQLLTHAEACAPALDDHMRALLPELASCADQYAEDAE